MPSPRLILWDIDHTLIDPNGEARLRLGYFWRECVAPVLEEARGYLPDIQTTLDITAISPPMLKHLTEPEHCCDLLFAIIMESAFGGAVQRWKPIHDDLFAAIFGPNRSYAPDIVEILQETAYPGEHYYPGILELLAELQQQGCHHALVTHREQPDSANVLSTLADTSLLLDYIESGMIFTQAHGAKSCAQGRQDLIQALRQSCENRGHPLIPEHTVMIGDMAHDGALALDLGCDFILAAYGHDKFTESPEEYYDVLAALQQRNDGYAIAKSCSELNAFLLE